MKLDLLIQKIIAIVAIMSLGWLLYSATWLMVLYSYVYYKIVVGLLGNQIAQHRFFSHRNFKTSNSRQWLLYLSSLTTGVNPVPYAIAHRHHHAHSDTANDVHSVHRKWADIFSPLTHHVTIKNAKVTRVIEHPTQKKINKFWWVLFIGYSLLFSIVSWQCIVYFALAGVGWNYVHMILLRVWLVHIKLPGSYRNFNTTDKSWNNKWIQILDLGEGLHNNHHQYPNRYNQATASGEFDFAGWVVKKFFAI
jgi:stearoyl-CoA desaturase (delta-9 desaturase)